MMSFPIFMILLVCVMVSIPILIFNNERIAYYLFHKRKYRDKWLRRKSTDTFWRVVSSRFTSSYRPSKFSLVSMHDGRLSDHDADYSDLESDYLILSDDEASKFEEAYEILNEKRAERHKRHLDAEVNTALREALKVAGVQEEELEQKLIEEKQKRMKPKKVEESPEQEVKSSRMSYILGMVSKK